MITMSTFGKKGIDKRLGEQNADLGNSSGKRISAADRHLIWTPSGNGGSRAENTALFRQRVHEDIQRISDSPILPQEVKDARDRSSSRDIQNILEEMKNNFN